MSLVHESPEHIYATLKENVPFKARLIANALPIAGTEEEGYSPIYRNAYSTHNLISRLHHSLDTLYTLFEFGYKFTAERNALGVREKLSDGSYGKYQWQDYRTIRQRSRNLGSGIFFILENNPFRTKSEVHRNLNYDPTRKKDSFILTIFSSNRPEWVLADIASFTYSITNTALYDTLGPNTSKYILELTESPIVLCSKEKISKLIELKKESDRMDKLIAVVSMDKLEGPEGSQLKRFAAANQIALFDYEYVEKLGETNQLTPIPPTPDTKFTICFTSGTTGSVPKGVVLTHENAIAGLVFKYGRGFKTGTTRLYSYLPAAHILERANLVYGVCVGAEIGFPSSKSTMALLDDVRELQPTNLATVPRVLSKLEATIKSQTIHSENLWTRYIYTKAITEKLRLQAQASDEDANPPHLVYDTLLETFKKRLGLASVKTIATGSSPSSPETIRFIKAALNVGVSNGYGSTESFAGFLCSKQFDHDPGSIGAIGVTAECRLRDIPEMNYTSKDAEGPRGELLLRGPQIFKEYYKNPEATAESFDKDGWFCSGDVARIDTNRGNQMYVVDRVKNFFKLAQGEFVTPEKIELVYLSSCPHIQQIFVYGTSLESYLIGIVGLDPASIADYLRSRFHNEIGVREDILRFLNDPSNKKIFLMDLNNAVKDQLQGFERIHNVEVDFDPLTVERGVITPTQKIRRPLCTKYFQENLDRMYQEGSILRNEKL
ncbi:hypothetical protein KGF57_000069 [Candida theae]|uniref:AMP-dependent synthetase/ligase domain-containing protein n=1 Tax=Candida theae TaxID=1198502 RepID=A0AAD5BJU0_9ASCO|nr:uncharacterized protein KGF57_000069 [Candida theae]KAI5968837.1 hypothetical protein KGF57_000069 [Candida theae]